ncbi:ATP-binding cassette domain-containing protein, partial [bacterium]|nr:ATP-binding cassette domain-containing protein [bacterium]
MRGAANQRCSILLRGHSHSNWESASLHQICGLRPVRALLAPSDAARAELLALRLDVAQHLDASPGRLSDGERRRLAIVVALAAAPDVLVLDEPSGGLDDERVAALCSLLSDRELLGSSAVVIATHDPRLSALSRPDARPLRRVRHPEETGTSVEPTEG